MSLINRLIGQNLGAIGRASNLLCIPIGEIVDRSRTGYNLTMYEIHCQCAWRLLDPQRQIIIASSDFYFPPSNVEWSQSFQWDVKGGNLFDEKIAIFNVSHSNSRIKKVIMSKCNDLTIEFEDASVFETFADSSIDENWRILQRSPKSTHLVLFGNQLRVDTD